MNTQESIESVEVVDQLMTYFRNGCQPADSLIVKAYDLGINVKELKRYIEEVENDRCTEEEYDEDIEWEE